MVGFTKKTNQLLSKLSLTRKTIEKREMQETVNRKVDNSVQVYINRVIQKQNVPCRLRTDSFTQLIQLICNHVTNTPRFILVNKEYESCMKVIHHSNQLVVKHSIIFWFCFKETNRLDKSKQYIHDTNKT